LKEAYRALESKDPDKVTKSLTQLTVGHVRSIK